MLAFLGVKLRADHIVARDNRGLFAAIIGRRNQIVRIFNHEVIAVDKIHMIAIFQTSNHWVRFI